MGALRIRVSYGPVGLGKTVKVRLYIPVPPYLFPARHHLEVAQSSPIRVVYGIEEMKERQYINTLGKVIREYPRGSQRNKTPLS